MSDRACGDLRVCARWPAAQRRARTRRSGRAAASASKSRSRQLASRGRRRIRGLDLDDDTLPDGPADREVVDAFLAAARHGDFDALLALLDPEIVQRTADVDGSVQEVHGARAVAARAQAFSQEGLDVRPALVDGRPGWTAYREGVIFTLGALTITDGCITDMDVLLDPTRIARATLAPLAL